MITKPKKRQTMLTTKITKKIKMSLILKNLKEILTEIKIKKYKKILLAYLNINLMICPIMNFSAMIPLFIK